MLEKIDGEFKAADAVLFGGDFAAFNHTETGLPALEALCKKHDAVFSVIGNCDEPEFLKELEKRDVSVENTLAYLASALREAAAEANLSARRRTSGRKKNSSRIFPSSNTLPAVPAKKAIGAISSSSRTIRRKTRNAMR